MLATARVLSRRSIAAGLHRSAAAAATTAAVPPPRPNMQPRQPQRTFVTASGLLMPIKTIDVPTMGDSITEGTIVDIPVAPGDYVNEDDVVLVLETDKVSVDVRAPEAGVLSEILGEVDDVVEVGSALYKLDTDAVAPEGSAAPAAAEEAPAAAAEPAPAAPVAAAAPAAPEPKKAAPPPPPPPAMQSVSTSLGKRPERRSKMSRMR